jgi:hypothetical protein
MPKDNENRKAIAELAENQKGICVEWILHQSSCLDKQEIALGSKLRLL